MAIGYGEACPKPERRKKTKARRKRQKLANVHLVREHVFARERDMCRCCRCRPAQSMHELIPRSLGGRVSKRNSIAVCGSGTSMCHGFLQTYQITWDADPQLIAEGTLTFYAQSKFAAEHMRINVGAVIVSPPMRETEISA